MNSKYDTLLTKIDLNPPCSIETIREVEENLKITFPKDYVNFLLASNGGEGWLGNASYISLWRVEEIEDLNQAYEVNEFAPGFILFGSNGGLDAYAFDTRGEVIRIVAVPFIGMDLREAKNCGKTFIEFLEYLYTKK